MTKGFNITMPDCGRLILLMLAAAAFVLLQADPALAQGYDARYAASCTYNPAFNIPVPATGSGIISLLVANISAIINNVAFAMYNALLGNVSFQQVVRAAMTLFVIIYGILFTFGMTQITMMDFLIRVIKIGIVATLLSAGSWDFFYTFVGRFFHDGTNWLIASMSSVALGTVSGINTAYPFAVLDNAIAAATSSRMFVTLIATFFTGPYGLFIGILIVMSLGTFASALFQAMWVYLMSLVVRAFLFAMAPIFFSFLLFGRTRHLFDGWVNALVSSMLQPVFLFTFFAFFAKLIEASLYALLRTPVCYTPLGVTWQGSPMEMFGWRFMVPVGHMTDPNGVVTYRWEMWAGGWSFAGAGCQGCPIFPLSIMDVLIFLLLVQLAYRFNGIVIQIAKDIAGASLALNMSGAISDWMSPTKGWMDSMKGAANKAERSQKGSGTDTADASSGARKGLTDPAAMRDFLAKMSSSRKDPGSS